MDFRTIIATNFVRAETDEAEAQAKYQSALEEAHARYRLADQATTKLRDAETAYTRAHLRARFYGILVRVFCW